MNRATISSRILRDRCALRTRPRVARRSTESRCAGFAERMMPIPIARMSGPSAPIAPAAIAAMFDCTVAAPSRIARMMVVASGTRSTVSPTDASSALKRPTIDATSDGVGSGPAMMPPKDCAKAMASSTEITMTGTAPAIQTRSAARVRVQPRATSQSIGASASDARSQPPASA